MSIVFDLPAVLQTGLYCEWLKLTDVARLDSALCCKKFRTEFLAILRCPQSIFAQYIFEHDISAAYWIIKRKVTMQSIFLFSNILRDDVLCLALLTSLCGPALECVTLCTYNDNQYDLMDEENICEGVEQFLVALASSCPNVRSFRIKSGCLYFGITDQSLVKLLSYCEKLCVLELPNCDCGGGDIFLRAIYEAPCLQTVSMSGGHIFDAVQDIPFDAISKTIMHLNCRGLSFNKPGTDLSHICAHFPNLLSLTATDVSNAVLVAIANFCPLLQDVTICVAEVVEEETALLVAQNWPHLRRLGLHLTMDDYEEDEFSGQSCVENGIISFIQNCPQLSYLNTVCRSCIYKERYGERAQNDICTEDAVSKLRELYVDSLSLGGFSQIRTMCPYLYLLAIHHENPYYVDDLTAEDIDASPLETCLRCINESTIKVLYVHNYCDLEGENLIDVIRLQEVYFSNIHSRLLYGEDIVNFVMHCSQLKVLSLRNSFSVPDNFVLPLLDACPSLTSLTIVNERTESEYMRHTPSIKMLESLVKRTYPNMVEFMVDCESFG